MDPAEKKVDEKQAVCHVSNRTFRQTPVNSVKKKKEK